LGNFVYLDKGKILGWIVEMEDWRRELALTGSEYGLNKYYS
jgi:hypothetical protein